MLFLASIGALIWGLVKPFKLFSANKLSRRKTAAIFGSIIVLSLVLIGLTAPEPKIKSDTKPQVTQSPTMPTSTPIPTAIPQPTSKPAVKLTAKPTAKPQAKVTKSPKQVLEDICKKHQAEDNCIVTQENGKWEVGTILETDTEFMLFDVAKKIARDFIFEVYATKLPIGHAAISINNYQTRKYYRAGLGDDVASKEPQSTWTSNDVGPTIFYDFLKANTTGTAGDYKNSTYVETNLK